MSLEKIPVDPEIAKAGGLFNRDYSKPQGVGLADAILAAIAESENAESKTPNTKHYPMMKGLLPAYKKIRANTCWPCRVGKS